MSYQEIRSSSSQEAVRIAPTRLVREGDLLGKPMSLWDRHTWERALTAEIDRLGVSNEYRPSTLTAGTLDAIQFDRFVDFAMQVHDGFTQFNGFINRAGVLGGDQTRARVPEFWLATDSYVGDHGPKADPNALRPFVRTYSADDKQDAQVFIPVESIMRDLALPDFDVIKPDSSGTYISKRGEILIDGLILSSFDMYNRLFSGYSDRNRIHCHSDKEYYAQPMRMFSLVATAGYVLSAVDAMFASAGEKQAQVASGAGSTRARRSARALSQNAERPATVTYTAFDPRTVEGMSSLIDKMWEGFESNSGVNAEQREFITRLRESFNEQVVTSPAMSQYQRDKSAPRVRVI